MVNIVNLLEVYSLEEILEYNDITVEELLEMLLEIGYIKIPEVEPLE